VAARQDFLTAMYKGMWDNINRHVTVLWQATAVLGTAFGAALLLKKVDSTTASDSTADFATAAVIAVSFWLVAHAFDASLWLNRNLQIISNIEHEFLSVADKERIHPYIGDVRKNEMLLHTRIQAWLGVIVGVGAYALHFRSRVAETLGQSNVIDVGRALPTAVLLIGLVVTGIIYRSTRASYADFLKRIGRRSVPSPAFTVRVRRRFARLFGGTA
jgi:hypothetical protein